MQGYFNQALKYVVKGFKYFFRENKGSMKKIVFKNLAYFQDDKLSACLKECPDLESLHFIQSTLNQETCKTIGKILSDYKNIRELDLSRSNIYQTYAKEIADGLMRAKRIEVIRLRGVQSIGNGVNQILYNLAFSPRIKSIDISNIALGTQPETCEGIYKLVKISGSLEFLNLNNCGLFDGLTRDFYVALGENKTLKALLLDSTTRLNNNLTEFGKAAAFNIKKNGSLEILSAVGGFDATQFNTFLRGMFVSEYDHEIWYGDKTAAAKFKGEQLEAKFLNPFKIIKLGKNNFNLTDVISEIRKKTNPQWPAIVHLFSSGLQKLDLTQCSINQKRTLEVLACCIENPIAKTSI